MRFDDSLATAMAADTATGFGAQAAWRQLVDLVGRGKAADVDAVIARLRELRGQVPDPVRAASGRALAWGEPPAPLVALFAEEELAVAAPVLRTARLTVPEWTGLLPRLTPAMRSVLRHRRDLPADVVRALESFGATDFVLGHDGAAPVLDLSLDAAVPEPDLPVAPEPEPAPSLPVAEPAPELPAVAEVRPVAGPPRSDIADLVQRIEAFRRRKPAEAVRPAENVAADRFHFETDAEGVIRWVDGVARGPLVGATLAHGGRQGAAQVDAAAGGALRARAPFRDVHLEVAGASTAAGSWSLAGLPQFEPGSGRFTGYTGLGRRPRRDERAAPASSASDSLRQLVHELRTPANAIAGFSELIGTELLGPVPPVYRDRAQLIQRQAAGLVAAIDDLDTAARIEGRALDLRPGIVHASSLLAQLAADLQPLAAERGAVLSLDLDRGAAVQADDRALSRLFDRLLTTVLALAEPGERVRVQLANKTRGVRLHVTRPRALATAGDDETLFAIDADRELDQGPLLGVGFTLRLIRNLAAALGGSLAINPDRLTLRLPAAQSTEMERATAQ